MAADPDRTAELSCGRYESYCWGEVIEGDKAFVQSFGIGVGRAFPGEPYAPPRALRLVDRRGFKVTVTRGHANEHRAEFRVRIPYPNIPPAPEFAAQTELAGGATFIRDWFADRYVGTQSALIAAGVILHGQFPGDPGMGKFRVTILSTGEVAVGRMARCGRAARRPGTKWVERIGNDRFEVRIMLDPYERDIRHSKVRQVEADWLRMVERTYRKPPRLTQVGEEVRSRAATAAQAAARDVAFQVALARIVGGL